LVTRTFTKWESFEAKIVFELVSGFYTLDDIEAIEGDNGEIMLKAPLNGGSCTYRYLGEEGGDPQDKTILDFLERLRTNVRIIPRDQKEFYNILGYFDPKEIVRFAKERKCDLSTIDVHLDWIENALIFEVTAKGPEDAEYLVSLGETWVPISQKVMTHEKMDELLSFASVGDVPSYVVSPSGDVAYVERTLDDSLVVYYGASTLPRAQELYEASAPLGEQLGTVFDYLQEEEDGYRLDEFPHYSLEDLADMIRSSAMPSEEYEDEEEMQESVEELQRVLASLAANPNADPTLVMASEATLNAMDFFLNQDTPEAAAALADPVGIFLVEFKKFKELEAGSTKGEKVERTPLDAVKAVAGDDSAKGEELLDAVRKAMLGTLKARQNDSQEPKSEGDFFSAFFEGLVEAAESGAFGINPFEGLSEEDWAPFNPEEEGETHKTFEYSKGPGQVEAPSDSGFGNLFGVVAAVAVMAAGVAVTQPKRPRLSTKETPRVQKVTVDVDAYEEAEGEGSLGLTPPTLAR
jgi:predicted DNA-binding ArsR family transcriptional regulator